MLTVEELREMNANFQSNDEGERTTTTPPYFTQDQKSLEQKDELSQKLSDLISKYDRQSVRFKHVLEERDELSRQVAELRRKVSDKDVPRGHDVGEEIRLLNKLMDQERSLCDAARESGSLPSDYDPYARHNKFVDAFISIVMREK